MSQPLSSFLSTLPFKLDESAHAKFLQKLPLPPELLNKIFTIIVNSSGSIAICDFSWTCKGFYFVAKTFFNNNEQIKGQLFRELDSSSGTLLPLNVRGPLFRNITGFVNQDQDQDRIYFIKNSHEEETILCFDKKKLNFLQIATGNYVPIPTSQGLFLLHPEHGIVKYEGKPVRRTSDPYFKGILLGHFVYENKIYYCIASATVIQGNKQVILNYYEYDFVNSKTSIPSSDLQKFIEGVEQKRVQHGLEYVLLCGQSLSEKKHGFLIAHGYLFINRIKREENSIVGAPLFGKSMFIDSPKFKRLVAFDHTWMVFTDTNALHQIHLLKKGTKESITIEISKFINLQQWEMRNTQIYLDNGFLFVILFHSCTIIHLQTLAEFSHKINAGTTIIHCWIKFESSEDLFILHMLTRNLADEVGIFSIPSTIKKPTTSSEAIKTLSKQPKKIRSLNNKIVVPQRRVVHDTKEMGPAQQARISRTHHIMMGIFICLTVIGFSILLGLALSNNPLFASARSALLTGAWVVLGTGSGLALVFGILGCVFRPRLSHVNLA